MIDKTTLVNAQMRFYEMAVLMLVTGDVFGELAKRGIDGLAEDASPEPASADGKG